MTRTRAISYAERDEINQQLEALLAGPSPAPDFVALYARIFKAPREAWKAARAAQLAAAGTARAAASAADTADEDLDARARRWFPTVRDASGRSLTASLAIRLGLPTTSELLELPYAEEVSRLRALFAQIDTDPSLLGDASLLAELRASVDVLSQAAPIAAAALRARISRTTELEVATFEFDRAWGKLRRALAGVLGDAWVAERLPVFARPRTPSDEPTPQGAPTV